MATLYTSFSSVPANNNARRNIMRAARLGTRTVAAPIDYGEALKVVDSARAYKEGWQDSVDPLALTVRSAWAVRSS